MHKYLCRVSIGTCLAGLALAAPNPAELERKENVARHRAIAAAHEEAAKCLEAGKKDELCEQALQAACKGLAIGKFCGMKH